MIQSNMKKEVSDRVVIILLILAILFSIGGTVIVYESVQEFKSNVNDYSDRPGSSLGLISLYVPEDSLEGGDNFETIE